jgi:hypothetical protein
MTVHQDDRFPAPAAQPRVWDIAEQAPNVKRAPKPALPVDDANMITDGDLNRQLPQPDSDGRP